MQNNFMTPEFVQQHGPPAYRNSTQALRVSIASKYTAAEFRAYINEKYGSIFPAQLYQGTRGVVKESMRQELSTYRPQDVMFMYSISSDSATSLVVTTFNVANIVKTLGYSMTFVSEVPDKYDAGSAKRGGGTFPVKNKDGYWKIEYGKDIQYLPIRGQFIDTNFFSVKGTEVHVYNQFVVETVALLSTFYYMKNGDVGVVQAEEAGAKLLNFSEILATNFSRSHLYITSQLKEWIERSPCPDSRGWRQMTLHGDDFSHALYSALTLILRENGDEIYTLSTISGMIVSSDAGPFLSLESGTMELKAANLSFPTVLNGATMDLTRHEATLDQAFFALSLARTFRGDNKSLRGASSRISYIGSNVTPGMAETSYMATNVKRFLGRSKEWIVLASESGSGGVLLQLLDALVMLDYDGIIVMHDIPSVRSALIPRVADEKIDFKDEQFKYGSGKFCVVLGNPLYYCLDNGTKKEGYFRPAKGACIMDLRSVPDDAYSRNEVDKYEAKLEGRYRAKIDEWQHWKFPVVGRTRLFTKLVTLLNETTYAYTGAEPHNLVMWITFGFKLPQTDKDWWYVLENANQLSELASWSIATNILRCVRILIRCRVMTALHYLKFKIPVIEMRSLGKMNTSLVAYQHVGIAAAVEKGAVATLEFFKQADAVTKALMISTPTIASVLEASDEGSSSGPAVAKPPGKRITGMNFGNLENPNLAD